MFDVDIDYHKGLKNTHKDLPFLLERMKVEKCQKLVCNLLCDRENMCYTHKSPEAGARRR